MSILNIYNCFHPILKEKAKKVEEFDQDLKNFTDNMLETMYNADGIGLAANQVGDRRAVFTVDIHSGEEDTSKYEPIVMINPEIISFSDDIVSYQEGCLSIPQYYEDVDRPESVEIKYYDIDMKEHKIEVNDILSRVIQHEYDHLKGILFFERISPLKRAMSKSKLNKIKRGDLKAHYKMTNPDGSEYIPETED